MAQHRGYYRCPDHGEYLYLSETTLLAKGDIIILELAPVDPRSLMQGDYMALSYALVAPFNEQFNAEQEKCREEPLLLCPESKRRLIVELDDRQRATAARIDQGEPLADNQHYLQYRFKGRSIQIGTDAYFSRKDMQKITSMHATVSFVLLKMVRRC